MEEDPSRFGCHRSARVASGGGAHSPQLLTRNFRVENVDYVDFVERGRPIDPAPAVGRPV
jgi:hypothetical protein